LKRLVSLFVVALLLTGTPILAIGMKNVVSAPSLSSLSRVYLDPPLPHFAVEPTPLGPWPLKFGPYTYAVGMTFNATAYLSDLDPAWGVTAASFGLRYNTTLINVTAYTIDPLWGTSSVAYVPAPDPSVDYDELDVAVGNPTGTPGGAKVDIISMEFQILYEDRIPPRPMGAYDETPIWFVNTVVEDHGAQIPTNPPEIGSVRIYCFYYTAMDDVAVVNIVPSQGVVAPGHSVSVNVTVMNQGVSTETFNVSLYVNETIVENETVVDLMGSVRFATVVFHWNTSGFVKGDYNISAYAWPVEGELPWDQANNWCTGSWIRVTILGDANGDGTVDMADISLMIDWFMAVYPEYNPYCDVNNDLTIDMADISIAIDHFMQT